MKVKREKTVHWIYESCKKRLTDAAGHLVELQQQDQAGPAGVIEGQQEDAEQPGRAADQGGDHAPQALLLIMHHAAGRPV